MALTKQQLQQTLQQALADNIASLAALSINARPDFSIDGRSYQVTALRKSLLEEQKAILQNIQALDGPFECVTYPPGS